MRIVREFHNDVEYLVRPVSGTCLLVIIMNFCYTFQYICGCLKGFEGLLFNFSVNLEPSQGGRYDQAFKRISISMKDHYLETVRDGLRLSHKL